ncbi:magnesium/cobalt transporter CorA [Candidatus Woesearchaeota archaeon]|nr:magnesium/cobalt transporter CorA [Candidatus Woesearchaeota archaeon]
MLHIFCLEGEQIIPLHTEDLKKKRNQRLWIDTINLTKKEAELLKNVFDLHPVTVEDMLNLRVRIKVEEFPDYVFSVFYTLRKSRQLESIEIDFVLGKNFLITNHPKDVGATAGLREKHEDLAMLLNKGSEYVMQRILSQEVDQFFPILEQIGEEVETIEEQITTRSKTDMLTKILALKRMVIKVRKIAIPQKEKAGMLAKMKYNVVDKKAIPYFRDVYDHTIKIADTIENDREAISDTLSFYVSVVSKNTNEVMRVLSVIATITIPLTVIPGIYGTNFTKLPGATTALGFWIMIIIMMAICWLILYYLRKKGWM